MALALLVLAGCDSGPDLYVDVRSDIVAGLEAVTVETRLHRALPIPVGDVPLRMETTTVSGDTDMLAGVRVAELDGVGAGDWAISVRILDSSGAILLERLALVRVRTDTAVTLLMTRDCRGVLCPAPAGDPALLACLGGRCVDPSCTPETPERCPPPQCVDPSMCVTPPAVCAMATCVSATCFASVDDALCPMAQRCHPENGCVGAGTMDAGSGDAGTGTSTGATVSVTTTGAVGQQEGYDLAADGSGNLFIAGQFDTAMDLGGGGITSNGGKDLFIASLGPDLSYRWSLGAGAGGSEDRASGITVDAAGDVYVAGHFEGSVDFGGTVRNSMGSWDGFVASYTNAGALRWVQRFGGAGGDLVYDVAVAPDGSVWATGYYEGAVDVGGGPLSDFGGSNVLVLQLDSATGLHLDSAGFGSIGSDAGRCIIVDRAGNAYIGLSTGGPTSFGGVPVDGVGVVSLGLAMAHRWTQPIGPGTVWAIERGSTDRIFVTGSISAPTDLGGGLRTPTAQDAFVVAYEPDGAYVWDQVFGGSESDLGLGLTVGAGDHVMAVGLAGVDVDFGMGLQTGGGGQDVFVASYAVDGTPRWGRLIGGLAQDRGHGIVAVGSRVFATGRFNGAVDFGMGREIAVSDDDFFLVELE